MPDKRSAHIAKQRVHLPVYLGGFHCKLVKKPSPQQPHGAPRMAVHSPGPAGLWLKPPFSRGSPGRSGVGDAPRPEAPGGLSRPPGPAPPPAGTHLGHPDVLHGGGAQPSSSCTSAAGREAAVRTWPLSPVFSCRPCF